MISTKSPREIALMREAGRITGFAHEEVKKVIRPGITTSELDQVIEEAIVSQGATPSFKGLYGFPKAVCISLNEELVHGIPGKTVLKTGDIISIDIGACYQGYHGDSAWTYSVGSISKEAEHLLQVTKDALFVGLKQVKAGNRLGDVSHAIGEYVYSFGYSIPADYTGHGIGSSVHEEPIIPNFGRAGMGVLLKEGMTLAIEPMVHAGKPFTKVLENDWTVVTKDGSLSAHFEHTVLITKDGYEILTRNIEEDHSING
jgi:methionine aminopeptidase, type I